MRAPQQVFDPHAIVLAWELAALTNLQKYNHSKVFKNTHYTLCNTETLIVAMS